MANELENVRKSTELTELAIINKIAVFVTSGVTSPKAIAEKIEKETGEKFHVNRVRALMAREETREIVESLTSSALSEARLRLKRGMANLVDKTISVVESHLDDNNLQAVPMVYKALTIEAEEKSEGDTKIVINLPDTSIRDAIKVEE